MSHILWPVEDTLPPLKCPAKSCKSQENLDKSTAFPSKKQFFYRALKTGAVGYKILHKIVRNCIHYTLIATPWTLEIIYFHIYYKILKDPFWSLLLPINLSINVSPEQHKPLKQSKQTLRTLEQAYGVPFMHQTRSIKIKGLLLL